MRPTEELMAEHEAVLASLVILERIGHRLEKGQTAETGPIQDLLEFFQVFVDRCHHGKEEELLFPELEKAGLPKQGGPVGVMLAEHETGRRLVRQMKAAAEALDNKEEGAARSFVQAARAYIDLLRQHIQKENQILFPLADQRLTAEQQAFLTQGFQRIEQERIGEGRHQAFHRMLEDLDRQYQG